MIRHALVLSASLIAALALIDGPAQAAAPAYISAAVADAARPAEDKQRDANRKPAETLEFAGIKQGEVVSELIGGGGYYTRILSKAVGPKGKVIEWAPPRPDNAPADRPDFAAKVKAIAAESGYSNVSVVQQAPASGLASEPVDVVFTALNYHDLHNIPGGDVAAFNKAVLAALKPGGLYIVIDHSAEKGSALRDTSTLHRIDEESVKSEVTAAGFEFVAASNLLANAADPRTAKVFDPAIRGKTDQFLLKFRKPKK
jgi:predicted methyltransferase